MKRRQMAVMAAFAAVLTVAVSGCGSAAADANIPQPVTIQFWSWLPGASDLVNTWNSEHTDIKVDLGTMSTSTQEYSKLTAAEASGTGPDLAQVEYQQIPTFAIQGILQDVSSLDSQYQDSYVDWAWADTGFDGQHYGIPNDTGAMVMYYNKALFDKYDLAVPTTWSQFEQEGKELKAKDPDAYMAPFLTGGAWQAALADASGASWFGIDGDSWEVSINDQQTKYILGLWAQMAEQGIVNIDPGFNPAFWAAMDDGDYATYIQGVWGQQGLTANLTKTAGDWAVAPIPQPDGATSIRSGNSGGSAWVVMKDSDHPEQALEFANWMASSAEAQNLQYSSSGFYPAAKNNSISALNQPSEFFGGQVLGPVYAQATADVNNTWQWGPDMSTVFQQLDDDARAIGTSGDYTATLDQVQNSAVSSMTKAGLSVKTP